MGDRLEPKVEDMYRTATCEATCELMSELCTCRTTDQDK